MHGLDKIYKIKSNHGRTFCLSFILRHDNARPHAAAATVDTIWRLRFQILEHPWQYPLLPSQDWIPEARFLNSDNVSFRMMIRLKRRRISD